MTKQELSAVCTQCHGAIRAPARRTFLGFRRLSCPLCKQRFIYPLTSGYHATYVVFVCLMLLGVLLGLMEGELRLPWVVGMFAVLALVKDRRIRREVRDAANMTGDAGAQAT